MIDFNNTKIAFHTKSTMELRKAKILFTFMGKDKMVKFGKTMYFFCKRIHFPVNWAIRPTIYKHFVGGESLEDCLGVVKELHKSKIKSILDYSAEGSVGETAIQSSFSEIMNSIDYAGRTTGIAFAVFKPSAMSYPELLEKVSTKEKLTEDEQTKYQQFLKRMDSLAQNAYEKGVRLLVDAEHYAYQQCIDDTVDTLTKKFNKDRAVVFHTLQMYRHDRLVFLEKLLNDAKTNGHIVGAKFVRGAYMEEERALAIEKGYEDPICDDKYSTDENFNEGVKFAIENISHFEVFCGTHNAVSCSRLAELIDHYSIPRNDERIYFSQLYGMSDNLSYILADMGYNVAKYIPYAPIDTIIPYLIRRANENTSMSGQTNRELGMIISEIKRRKEEGS